MKSSVRWSGNLDPNLRNATRKAEFYLAKTTAYYSLRVEAYARRNARWTDRTGNARSGLTGTYQIGGGMYQIDLFHKVNYGIFLETKRGKRGGATKYPIIMRTLNAEGKRFIDTANKVLINMFGGQ